MMLYLEDFLEMIENLPMEMRDRFTEMREMDLQVENAMDSLDDKVKSFFRKCSSVPNLKQEWKDEQMAKIKQEYQKALEDADEKVQIANQMYELVERHLRKLDQEVSKFKMELEADNSGITEILELRANEPDKSTVPINNHKAEKRKHASLRMPLLNDRGHPTLSSADLMRDSSNFSFSTKSNSSTTSSPAATMFDSSVHKIPVVPPVSASPVNYNLGQVGSGSNAAIAVAASRAIGATLEMQQGRRSASLKASYVAVSKNFDLTKDITLGRELTSAGSSGHKLSTSMNKFTGAESLSAAPSKSSIKKKASSRSSNSQQQQQQYQHQQHLSATDHLSVTSGEGVKTDDKTSNATATTAWQIDPNEPRYCICNDVSYGDMVGCDNEDCPLEWFHYGCVGLHQAPRGKWYCPQCLASMKRRGRK